MEMEAVIAVIETKLKEIKEDTSEIKNCLFGNGSKGLKTKVVILEVKFWIIIILSLFFLAPMSVEAIKNLMGG